MKGTCMGNGEKTLEEIKDYWEKTATGERDEKGLRPTARDPFLQELVEKAVEDRLPEGVRLLDLGCGDGLSTLRFGGRASEAVGVDFIERYVHLASRNAETAGVKNVRFRRADVMDLAGVRGEFGLFDAAVSIRCLINLSAWENQARALGEIAACLRPDGLYLASEGWAEAMDGLNLRRRRLGLPPIETAAFNRLIPRADFESEAGRYFQVVDYVGLGFYIFLSRVFQPAFTAPDPPRHDHPINECAARVQTSGLGFADFADCDYAGVYVLKRK
ncbi:MAG: class I SAM-dependent methyltransferase [Thermodesulfobacteriota bacterium]